MFEFYGYICPIINKQTDKQIMDVPPHNDNERFRRLSLLGRIGWWEADFSAEQYLCSEYVCDLLGMKGDSLSFQDFGRMIREDYRGRITREFLSIKEVEVYEQTFPIHTATGVVWVHSRMGYRELAPDGHLKAFGILQRVTEPVNKEDKDRMYHINNLLYRQNSISHSLSHFLKDESVASGIYEILKDILDFFHAGRAYIFEYEKDYTFQTCTYEVVAEGVLPAVEAFRTIPVTFMPWWTTQVLSQKPILFESLYKLPEMEEGEFRLLEQQGIKALMAVPLVANDTVKGFMGVDLVDRTILWSNEDYQWLGSLANIISICVELRKTQDEAIRERQALDRSEKLFRNIFANIPAGVEIYDTDGFLVDVNNKNIEIFGIRDKADVIGINLFENPNLSPQLIEQIRDRDIVDFRLDYEFENVEGYYPSGKRNKINLYTKISKLYDSKGNFTGYAFINIDNTERMDALNRICDFENFFLLISDYAKVGYAKSNLLDKKGYAIKQWYKNMGEDENTPLSDIIGVYNKMHPDDRKRILDFLYKARLGEVRDFKGEIRILHPGTEAQWNWVRTNVVVNQYQPENGVIELISVNYDITELKETEAKLIDAKEKAETADRLKSAFLANMSHEIRTPLNAIVGFSSLLVQGENPEEREQYMAIVEENNELLLQLISDILDLSKIEAGTFDFVKQELDVNQLCEDMVRTMKLKARPGVEVVFDHRLPECIIVSDRNRLNQVIANFMNNAIKFTSTGSIRLGYGQAETNLLRFYVADTGIGIIQEKQAEIFDRFVKLNSFAQGTGLGLAICRMIIEKIGGEIGATSEIGKGSTFYFTIPYKESSDDRIAFSEASETKYISHTIKRMQKIKKILVAEDVDSNFVLIKNMIGKDYTLLWAKDGFEAVEMYKQFQPDLILMDIKMPRMGGLEATRIIRSYSKEIPVIALTAYAFEADKEQALEAGCNDFVTKPVSKAALEEALGKCCG